MGEIVRIIAVACALISACVIAMAGQVRLSAAEAPLTFHTDDPAPEAELDESSYQDLVADAQRMLGLRGYDPGPIDGKLGLRTQDAIRSYQDTARINGVLDALKSGGQPPDQALDSARYSFERRPTPTSIRQN